MRILFLSCGTEGDINDKPGIELSKIKLPIISVLKINAMTIMTFPHRTLIRFSGATFLSPDNDKRSSTRTIRILELPRYIKETIKGTV